MTKLCNPTAKGREESNLCSVVVGASAELGRVGGGGWMGVCVIQDSVHKLALTECISIPVSSPTTPAQSSKHNGRSNT